MATVSVHPSRSERLYTPSVLELALDAHSDTRIYHEINKRLHGRGDCKENSERLLRFFEQSGLDLAKFSVIYIKRFDEDSWPMRLPFDKAALRKEEQRILLKHVLTGKYRRRQMLMKLHFAIMDQSQRIYDLSARQNLMGIELHPYFETMFKLELEKNRKEFLHEIELEVCPAAQYFDVGNAEEDGYVTGFKRMDIRSTLAAAMQR